MIRVLIVGGLPDIMQVLQMEIELESDIQVIGGVESKDGAIGDIIKKHPDVVLVDTDLPGKGGIAAARELKEAAPNIPIIILSLNDDRNIRREAREVGAVAFVLKATNLSTLLNAIRQAAGSDPH
jgi:DNA-binding NarL/FixJ family response regulator